MKKFKIPVFWGMMDVVEVEAKDLDSALSLVNDMPLTQGEYIDGSFEVNTELLPYYNSK